MNRREFNRSFGSLVAFSGSLPAFLGKTAAQAPTSERPPDLRATRRTRHNSRRRPAHGRQRRAQHRHPVPRSRLCPAPADAEADERPSNRRHDRSARLDVGTPQLAQRSCPVRSAGDRLPEPEPVALPLDGRLASRQHGRRAQRGLDRQGPPPHPGRRVVPSRRAERVGSARADRSAGPGPVDRDAG
jgi:hypothetical protein